MERQWEVRSGVKLGLPNFTRGRGGEGGEGGGGRRRRRRSRRIRRRGNRSKSRKRNRRGKKKDFRWLKKGKEAVGAERGEKVQRQLGNSFEG